MQKSEIYEMIREKGIWHEITEHKPVFTMEELKDVTLPYPDREAKNLFVRDDKKRNYYLITVMGEKTVQLREFRQRMGTRPLSFASADGLLQKLKLTPGSVTPFGLLNNEEKDVAFFLDEDFLTGSEIIGIHPNENTATVWIKTWELVKILEDFGISVNVVKLY